MLNIGIIGCGKIAQVRHLPEYEQNPGARIAGLYDLNLERAQALAAQYGAKAYESYEALLADPAIASDALVAAQNDTFDRTSILQPFVASMNNCWTPVENMGKGIRSGTITHENAAEQTEAMNDAMNSNGIS